MSIRAPRPIRAEYRRFYPIQTRWSDNDMYGHANNTIYYAWYDTAINAVMIESDGLDPWKGPILDYIVESGCRYHVAVGFPDVIEVGMRIRGMGNSSIRWECAIFRQGDPQAAADGHMIHVFVDRQSKRPSPIPPILRHSLESLVIG